MKGGVRRNWKSAPKPREQTGIFKVTRAAAKKPEEKFSSDINATLI